MQEQTEKKHLTGYPSIDKPWLKYYSEEAINAPLPEGSMFEFIENNNKGNVDYPALRYYGATITYRHLFEMIHRAAAAYYSLGIRAGDIVTVMSMQTPETIASIYALNSIGATANMVYLSLSEHEIINTLHNTKSKALAILDVALPKLEKIKSEITIPVIVLEIRESMPLGAKLIYSVKNRTKTYNYLSYHDFTREEHSAPELNGRASDAAVIVYTSGTTGEPKGVVLSNQNLNCVAQQCTSAGKNYQPRERTFFYLPPFTGYGIAMLHLALSFGIDITIHLGLDVNEITKRFLKARPNRIAGGPAFTEALINHGAGDLSYLIDFTGGGESFSREKEIIINDFLKEHGSSAKYTTGYGMTEFASVVCMQMNHIYKNGSLGIPLPKANVKIIDTDTGKELAYGQIGEMCFSAPNAMQGYYKNKEATKAITEVDKQGISWIHTGDLGYVDDDGFVFFKGRLKRVYLVKDKNGAMMKLFPKRIEDFLEGQPNVISCGVIVKEDKERLHVPIAFLAVSKDFDLELTTLAVENGLPEHLRPVAIYTADKIPLTANGKTDYQELEQQAEALM